MESVLKMEKNSQLLSKPSKTAYQDKFSHLHKLNEELTLADSKGKWQISGLSPKDIVHCGNEKVQRYELYLRLLNENNPKLRWTYTVYVAVWENDGIEELKRSIKSYTGYIPQPKTLKAIYQLTHEMILAWKEQDLWYQLQDKQRALRKKEQLKQLLIQRYKDGKEQRESERRYRNVPVWLMYLTKEEEEELKGFQRIINGRYYLDETTSYGTAHGILGLQDFSSEVIKVLYQIDQERKRQSEMKNNQRLRELLETEPVLRKIVAHYIQAKKESSIYGVKDATIQLIHRLYGYSNNEKQYYQKYFEFSDAYLKPFSITIWDLYFMAWEAKKINELLPPAPANHQRSKKYHYGDQVMINGNPKMIKRVGMKYLYVENVRDRILLNKAEPYEKSS